MRDKLIDIAKGIGILLVVFAHIYEGFATEIIYLFHMPLFFYLSGATFSFSKSKFNGNFVIKRIKALLVPYVIFSLISFIYWWRFESHFRPILDSSIFPGKLGELSIPLQQFINIFVSISEGKAFIYNSPLWFLTCLFTSIICYSIIRKYSGKYSGLFCCLGAASYYIMVMEGQNLRLPFCFEIALTTLPLLWLGDMTYKKLEMSSFQKGIIMSIISLTICITIISVYHPSINMMEHKLSIWWQFYLCSISFIVLLILFGKFVLWGDEFGVLQWLGKNSLIIMCVHGPIYRIVLYAISIMIKENISDIRHSLFMSSCIVLLVVVIIIPIVVIINKHLPFLLGRKRMAC